MIYYFSYINLLGAKTTETVSGLGNWKLKIRREENSVTILRAVTCDTDAVLPDEIFSLPVRALSDRALMPGAREVEGEELLVVCGRPGEEWNNRNIRSLTLPQTLVSVGAYAFMNCSSMKTLHLHDSIRELHATSFTNCRSFNTIDLVRVGEEQGPTLSNVVSWFARELDVTITLTNGEKMRLIFPEYYESYEENGPTHFFTYLIEGTGFSYHNTFKNRVLNAMDYDGLWEKYQSMGYDEDTALRLAWWRLRFPAELAEEHAAAYKKFVDARPTAAFELALTAKDMDGLRMLLKNRELTANELARAQERARELHLTEATAILLEEQHRRFSGGRSKSFDL